MLYALMITSPLEQFEINVIYPLSFLGFFDVSLTNATVYSLMSMSFFILLLLLGSWNVFLVPLRFQSFIELMYQFIFDMIKNQSGLKGQQYFPLFFLTFGFILFANLLGLTPYAFTATSHIILTFTLGFSFWLSFIIVGFMRQGLTFLTLFVPSGVPAAILPLLIIIEFMSFCIRPISLSVRLFANMLAGHTLLNIIGGFVVKLLKVSFIAGFLAMIFLLAITFLEFGIALLQAYVFVILLSIFLKDSIIVGH